MSNPPLVSIGMPVYNSARHIRRALDSLCAQDFADFELIIADDGSSDATVEICREYAERDERISLHANAVNAGPLANFSGVLDRARGEYFMWAAHDDYRDRNYISALLARLRAGESLGLCVARFVKVMPDGRVISVHNFPEVPAADAATQIRRTMPGAGAPWVYGLYRASALRPIHREVRRIGLVWFWDHLVVLNFLLNGALAGTNDTTIFQVKTGFSAPLYMPQSLGAYLRFGARAVPQSYKILLKSQLSAAQKLYLAPSLALYMDMQVFHVRRWARAQPAFVAARRYYRRWRKGAAA